MIQINGQNAIHKILNANGVFPNNEALPLIIYKGVLPPETGDPAAYFEDVFQKNYWVSSWRNGIYPYHHYHSAAHEVLGVYRGKAGVLLGGPGQFETELEKGDVVVIPAGVAHKNLGDSGDFACVGAYPNGQAYDMNYGREGERPDVDENIKNTPLPQFDPLFGSSGPLVELWFNKK